MGSRVSSPLARVAELADAQDSGSCARKGVGVQVPPRAPLGGTSLMVAERDPRRRDRLDLSVT